MTIISLSFHMSHKVLFLLSSLWSEKSKIRISDDYWLDSNSQFSELTIFVGILTTGPIDSLHTPTTGG